MKCHLNVGGNTYYFQTGQQFEDGFYLLLDNTNYIYGYPKFSNLHINEKKELLGILLKFRLDYPHSSFGAASYTEAARIVSETIMFEVMP